jgi:hypothetical protein
MCIRDRASGQGADALASLSRSLLNVGNEAQRNAAFVQIFGASVEDVSDPKAVLELLATADAVGKIGTQAQDAAKQLNNTQTSLDDLKRKAGTAGEAVAGVLNFALAQTSGDAKGTESALANLLDGPLGKLVPKSEELAAAFRRTSDETSDLADSTKSVESAMADVPGAFDKSAKGAGNLASGAGKAADALDNVATTADDVRKHLEGIFNFNADKLLRDIADQGDALAQTFAEAGKKAVGLGGAIDITKKGGADLQSQFEDLNGSLIDAAVAFKNNEITAGQFATVQQAVTGQFNEATRAAGLTTDQVEGLRQKYLAIPSRIQTEIGVNVADAKLAVANLQAELAKLPTTKTITIQTRNAVIAATAQTTILGRETGGPARGLTLVGEKGPELVDFGTNTAYVYNNQQTRSLLAGAAVAGQPATSAQSARGGALIENATIMVAPGRDLFQELASAEAYYRAVAA